MWPTAYAMVVTVSPKANATPRKPMPSWTRSPLRKREARTAAPQPAKTSQKVPRNSAASLRGSKELEVSAIGLLLLRAETAQSRDRGCNQQKLTACGTRGTADPPTSGPFLATRRLSCQPRVPRRYAPRQDPRRRRCHEHANGQ